MAKYTKGKAVQLSKNFKSTEFDCKCGNCATTLVDQALVELLQKIRDHFGKALVINSGYRCNAHNKAIGGATNSQHTYGKAADIVVKGVVAADVYKYADSIGTRGLGKYNTFTHVDTRSKKARWQD